MVNRSPENEKELDVELEWVPAGTGREGLLLSRRAQALAEGLVKACVLSVGLVWTRLQASISGGRIGRPVQKITSIRRQHGEAPRQHSKGL